MTHYQSYLDSALLEVDALEALNAELLAALIQMETWASLYRAELTIFSGQSVETGSLYWRETEQARAVIAKAKELDQ